MFSVGKHVFYFCYRKLCVCSVLFKVLDHIADRNQSLDVVVIDLNREFFLAEENEVCQLQRVDAEIVFKLCVKTDVIRIDRQFLNEDRFKLSYILISS